MRRSLHIAQHVRCPAVVAYAYASDPANLATWAAGLGGPVVQVDGQWRVRSPDGDVVLQLSPANDLGVLDHTVVLPDGTRVDNPLRVLADGDDCDVVFTLRRQPGTTDDEFELDAAAVAKDLRTLRDVLERRR
jgi:hypothetical protein